jgi:hypothetical protein
MSRALSVPYFPIEVSRVLASTSYAYWSFIGGVASFILFHTPLTFHFVTAWLFTLGIGIIDDNTSWKLHMLFVLGLFLTTLHKAFMSSNNLYMCAMACCLYAARIVFKFGAVILFHHNATIYNAGEISLQIMFGIIKPENEATLFAFQLGGVLQWIVLFIVGKIILN